MSKRTTAHVLDNKWRSDDIKIGEDADFSSLLLPKDLLKGLKLAGFKYPSPIQLQAIPVGKIGKDLIVQAKSGTGKTLVFTVVALNMLIRDATHPQVLILAPTREIACQICQAIKSVASSYKNFDCEYFIGGRMVSSDIPRIQGCQVVVGTPGRIKQLITSKILKTGGIRLFVLDEADTLLRETSFSKDINDIFRALPRDKQMIATSATFPERLKRLTDKYFRDPLLIRLNKNDIGLLGMVHYYRLIPVSKLPVTAYREKLKALENVLVSVKFAQCLVFCKMVSRVENLCVEIKNWGFSATFICSTREQEDRLKAIQLLKKFKCKVLVSSDVSSRGIDAENVDLVINFDLTTHLDTYFHRVGRAGRYGSKCASVTFVTSDEIDAYEIMQLDGKFRSYPLPDCIPTDLISQQPTMEPVLKERDLPLVDGSESSSDSSPDRDGLNENGVVKQKKTNGVSENIELNGHDKLMCISKVDKFASASMSNPSDEKNLVDSEVVSTESGNSHEKQNQLLDLNSNSSSSVKDDYELNSSPEFLEHESDKTDSPASVVLERQELVSGVCSSTEIGEAGKENCQFNESNRLESFDIHLQNGEKLNDQSSTTSVVEQIENSLSDTFSHNIHEFQHITDSSSCLADAESMAEKSVKAKITDVKSLVVNNECDDSKILNNSKSKELVTSVIAYIKEYENLNNVSLNPDVFCTDDSSKPFPSTKVESNDCEFSAESLKHLRSDLKQYLYNVCIDFVGSIPSSCRIEQLPEIREQSGLKQNGENKIQHSSLDSKHVLFSTPKAEVSSVTKSDHSSGPESSSGSDKDKLIQHFNLMLASIHKTKPSAGKNSMLESSSDSESNSGTSVNSKDAMEILTKEFNKMELERATGYNKEGNKNTGKTNIITNADSLNSTSSSDSGTSVDSENESNALEKEFTKFTKDKRNDGGSKKDTEELKKVLQDMKSRKKCFKGIEIAGTKKQVESSSSTSSDTEDVDAKVQDAKRAFSCSSSESGCSSAVSSSPCSSDSDSSTDDDNANNRLKGLDKKLQKKRIEASNTRKSAKSSSYKTKTVKGLAENKITYYYSRARSSETERDIDKCSKDPNSGLQDRCERKTNKKGKMRTKTVRGPAQNKITYFYSGASSSKTDSDIDQHSEGFCSSLQDRYQRETNQKAKILAKAVNVPVENKKVRAKTVNVPVENKKVRAKTVNVPVENEILNYSEESSSEYEVCQSTKEPHSSLLVGGTSKKEIGHQRKKEANKNDETQVKTKASGFDYCNVNKSSNPCLNPESERKFLPPYQNQPSYHNYDPYSGQYSLPCENHANREPFYNSHSSCQMRPTSHASDPYYQPYSQQTRSLVDHALFLATSHLQSYGSQCQVQNSSYPSHLRHTTCQVHNLPYSSECPFRESQQMSERPPGSQPAGCGYTSNCCTGYSNSQRIQSAHPFNQCVVPSQHPCHPPNETCQSPACAAWYDAFYRQWQLLNQSPYF